MAKKGVDARGRRGARTDADPSAPILRRVGWVTLAAVWVFLVLALASFDAADRPSVVVAVHNEPAANLCGSVGAHVAYQAYAVIGTGVWVLVLGIGGFLGVTATRRRVGHPLVRFVGILIATLAISCLHALLWPDRGSIAGAPAGVTAAALVNELLPRFNAVGSFLILLAGLAIGAVVAVDRLVLAAAAAVVRGLRTLAAAPASMRAGLSNLFARPRAVLASARARGGQEEPEDEYENEEEDDEYEYVDKEEDEYEEEEDEEEEDAAEEPARPRLTAADLKKKIAALPVRIAGSLKTVAKDEDIPRAPSFEGYQFPTLEMLLDPETNYSAKMEAFVREQAEHLEQTLHTYGIDAEVKGIESGPAVTLYSVQLAPGTKVAKISAISSDIARSLKAQNIRLVPNMVGKTTIGIEVPNIHRERVRLKELMSGGHASKMVLPMFLGKDAAGEPLVADLTQMPHMLIAGTTGSGKSVCMNSIIMSWLYTKRPDELKLVLVDPKMVEMSQFGDIPHLMCPVVTEAARAAAIMEWAVERMEERYELLNEACVRDIAAYNELGEERLYELFEAETDSERARIPKKMPYIVFLVDELADMMMACKEVEHSIVRIAQKARAVGLHLILATQRPQANVVTGLIKSNMPCRVSFKVASGMDSRIVLDSKGAELLLGQGDMLVLTPHTIDPSRAQGTFVEDIEVRRVVKFLKRVAVPSFERSLISLRPGGGGGDDDLPIDQRDPLFDAAVRTMIESGRGSVSLLQRRLSVGYGRASRLVDQMAQAGIVGEHKGSVAREVMITLEEWERMRAMEESDADDADGAPLIETTSNGPVPSEIDDEYRE